MPRAALRPAFLAVWFTFAAANDPGAAPPRPTCPVAPSDPWHTSAGFCCCSGDCLYDGCPPCPCPAPLPGHKQPQCSLAKMKAAFIATYKAVVAKTKPNDYPAKTALSSDGHWDWAYSTGWTSGFFPGLLWQLANSTDDPSFKEAAMQWTAGREIEKTETSGHDIGFMIFGSFGNGIQLGSDNATYADVVVEAAHSLAKRYNPKVGMTRSWGAITDNESFEVIIDNLMNLELLFWAAAFSGNKTLDHMARSHASKTGELWIRKDGSTAHLCVFDPSTGKLQTPCTGTPQGLAANSTWARGQAWGIYGFTMAFRYTQDASYLKFAETVAEFYLAATSPDLIPLWDFNVSAPQNYTDTSAATITASALLELAVFTEKSKYRNAAVQILHSIGWKPGLLSSEGVSDAVLASNRHDCQDDKCTLIETEYYMFEAFRRLAGEFPPETAIASASLH